MDGEERWKEPRGKGKRGEGPCGRTREQGSGQIHEYLAHKKTHPSQHPTVGLCLGSYGGPRGVVVFLMGEVPQHAACDQEGYRVTSLIRNDTPLGPYCRAMPRALW